MQMERTKINLILHFLRLHQYKVNSIFNHKSKITFTLLNYCKDRILSTWEFSENESRLSVAVGNSTSLILSLARWLQEKK